MKQESDVYCSTTEFKANLRQYKVIAQSQVVHILEHGRAGYVLASLEVLDRLRESARRRAVWQVDVEDACWRAAHCGDCSARRPYDVVVEYLGHEGGWRASIAPSFDDDVRRKELSDEALGLVRQRLRLLADNAHVGLAVELDEPARVARDLTIYRLGAGPYDIIYTVGADESVRVCGLIEACEP